MPPIARRRAATPWVVLVAAAVVLTGFGLLVAPAPAFAWSAGSYSAADESELVTLTNQARASAGLPALRSIGARLHRPLAEQGHDRPRLLQPRHPGPDGHTVFDEMTARLLLQRWPARTSAGTTTPTTRPRPRSRQMFMDSPGHRANILGPAWDVIGIGAYKGSDGKKMWTVLFADKCGSASRQPTPKPTPKPKPTADARARRRGRRPRRRPRRPATAHADADAGRSPRRADR